MTLLFLTLLLQMGTACLCLQLGTALPGLGIAAVLVFLLPRRGSATLCTLLCLCLTGLCYTVSISAARLGLLVVVGLSRVIELHAPFGAEKNCGVQRHNAPLAMPLQGCLEKLCSCVMQCLSST